MNARAKQMIDEEAPSISKTDPTAPAFRVTGRDSLVIKAGTVFAEQSFAEDTPVQAPEGGYTPGADYVVVARNSAVIAIAATTIPLDTIGGFHFAPGGNAAAREGGDAVPAINPCSLWDRSFHPACADPRGMVFIDRSGAPFWCDIYLTGANAHADGTSRFGVTIADGDDRPHGPDGKKYKRFDYEAACAVMAAHGKGLLSIEEFFTAAYGVTERTSADNNPKTTGLDAARTSRFGLMQATGNMWVWGHDGDPDRPRASFLGGSWINGVGAGSRCAGVGHWTDFSNGDLGARGRSDHLQLG